MLAPVQRFGLYGLAALTLVLIGFAAWTQARFPYNGLSYSYRNGVVTSVDPNGPAAGKIRPGDHIYFVDWKYALTTRELPTRKPGDEILYLVYGRVPSDLGVPQEDYYRARVVLTPPPPHVLWDRLSPLLIALCFWMVGVLVLALSEPGRVVRLFFLFCQSFVLILTVGSLSSFEPAWIGRAYGLLLWWAGPLAVHTHLVFLAPEDQRWTRRVVLALYSLALALTLLDILGNQAFFPASIPLPHYLWLGVALLVSLVLPFFAVRIGKTREVRQTALIQAMSASIGLLPFVLFSLIPESLTGLPYLRYEISFLALPVIPLGYGYAILRFRVVNLERYVNRSAAYALAAMLIGAAYGLVFMLAPQLMPGKDRRLTVIGLGVTVLLIFLAHPLYLALQRMLNQLFYGGWYDDRTAVRQVSQALDQAEGDGAGIARTLCQALQKTMQLDYVNLLMVDGSLYSATGPQAAAQAPGELLPPEEAAGYLAMLQKRAGLAVGSARELSTVLSLNETTSRRLLGPRPQLWLLLSGSRVKSQAMGLLILGGRRGGEFDSKDLEILEVVVRQAKMALENAELLEEVRQNTEQIRRLHRQVLEAREEERKRVARDLHDQTIQALVGLNYRLAVERSRLDAQTSASLGRLQAELRAILNDVRQVCADLRPPALDTLGLAPALQSRIAELEGQVPFAIRFLEMGDEETELPEHVALCLYRVFQEAIQNAKKHAGANSVIVRLQVGGGEARLDIQDDGRGFNPPSRLALLAQERHFGLVGLQELLNSVQGSLSIETAPGQGCQITARVPVLNENPPAAEGVTAAAPDVLLHFAERHDNI